MKVAELEGQMLDYWVARADGWEPHDRKGNWVCGGVAALYMKKGHGHRCWHCNAIQYSSDWDAGGLIIERERITLHPGPSGWGAWIHPAIHDPTSWSMPMADGPTPLIAAMRCFVASKFGETVSQFEAIAADVLNRAFEKAGI